MELNFATSNEHKYKEAKMILKKEGIGVNWIPFSHTEIRSESFEEIAVDAVKAAYRKIKKPVFVEDGGLVVESLNGFPCTFSAWVQRKIGSAGVLKLMDGVENRTARFMLAIAWTDGEKVKTFTAYSEGTITNEKKGVSGFGYDSIFIPNGYEKTFAESPEIKEKISHRKKALMKLITFIKKL